MLLKEMLFLPLIPQKKSKKMQKKIDFLQKIICILLNLCYIIYSDRGKA